MWPWTRPAELSELIAYVITPALVGCLVKCNHPKLAGVTSLEALSLRLRRLRQHHELTQEQFAETIGLSYKFYQQIEAGRKKQIWLETVERLAIGFGLEAWQLLSPDEPTQTTVRSGTRKEKTVEHKAVAVPVAKGKQGKRRSSAVG